jgi:hypothetical protein
MSAVRVYFFNAHCEWQIWLMVMIFSEQCIKITHLLQNQEECGRVHNSSPIIVTLKYLSPFHIPTYNFFTIPFTSSYPHIFSSFSYQTIFVFGFSDKKACIHVYVSPPLKIVHPKWTKEEHTAYKYNMFRADFHFVK